MSGGHNAHVNFLRPSASQALKFPLLQDTKKLRLELQRDVANFVQEQRALMRELEPADLLCDRAGERATLMPKEFAFEQPGGDGGAVEFDEWPIPARTVAVNGARDEFFARAGLAEQEHRGISPGDGFDELQHAAKTRTSANDPFEAGLRVQWLVDPVEI